MADEPILDRSVEITAEDVIQGIRQTGEKLNYDEVRMERAIENFKHYAEGGSITFWYPATFLKGLKGVGAREEDFKNTDTLLKRTLNILFDIFISVLSMSFPPEALQEVNSVLLLVYSAQTMKLMERKRKENG